MSKETPNYLPHNISPDGKYGIIDTGLPDFLPQEVVTYFPNGYKEPVLVAAPEEGKLAIVNNEEPQPK